MTILDPPQESVTAVYLLPVANYLLRLAEVMALAGLFHATAAQTEHLLIDIFAWALTLLVGFYAGLGFGWLFGLIRKARPKSWKVGLAISLPPALLFGWGAMVLGEVLTEAVQVIGQTGL